MKAIARRSKRKAKVAEEKKTVIEDGDLKLDIEGKRLYIWKRNQSYNKGIRYA